MALPMSGKSGSNVMKLEDIRNKRKKSKHDKLKQSQPSNEEANHVSTDSLETKAQQNSSEHLVKLRTVPTFETDKTGSQVVKAPAKRILVSNRSFDKVKVDRIKTEIANGHYKIDHLRVTDRFIEHERFR